MADRNIVKIIRMTPDELQMIQQKMQQFGTTNFSAFVRKMAIDGYVVKLELPELKEMVSLLRYSSNNLNQLTTKPEDSMTLIWRNCSRARNGCGMPRRVSLPL